jgi:hypothetical protein
MLEALIVASLYVLVALVYMGAVVHAQEAVKQPTERPMCAALAVAHVFWASALWYLLNLAGV